MILLDMNMPKSCDRCSIHCQVTKNDSVLWHDRRKDDCPIKLIDICREDAVSRQAVKEQMIKYGFHAPDMTVTEFVEDCLPSVTPQYTDAEIQKMQELEQAEIEKAYELGKAEQQKMGHWIDNHNNTISCDRCHTWFNKDDRYGYMHYCPYCNAKMESEDNGCNY